MKTQPSLKFLLLSLGVACAAIFRASADSITVQVDKPGVKISPTFFGLMTEEINHSYDGGLYGELIQNRVFKDNDRTPTNWSVVHAEGAAATAVVDETVALSDALGTSLRIDVTGATDTLRAGVANQGYWGIPVKPDTRYNASFYAKAASGFDGSVTVGIESNDGSTVYAEAKVRRISGDWKKYSVVLTTGKVDPTAKARFVLTFNRPGTIWLNLVSLFPPTFNNRPNGNRVDLMDILGGMKPSFLRLPGGNYVEGDYIATRFNWKKTIGDLEQRPGHPGTWNYRSSDGMGLLEFLEWCEDLKMQPVLAVWAGYALRGEHIGAGPELVPYVQDALDEIEYVTGSTSTKWGAVRARDGHPAPFPLTYVEVGNEDFFDRSKSYEGRYAQFHDAIKAKYPNLQIIATTPLTNSTPDVVDDHYYRSARAMEIDANHYDTNSRSGPKIFVGEWATTEGSPTPTMNAALGDAAWLTGLERNQDLVVMEAYAPLLVNVNPGARQWATDLIGYDALNSFGSPSYYVQKMFASGHGDVVLPVDVNAASNTDVVPFTSKGGIGVGTWGTKAEYKDIKVTHDGETLFESDFSKGTNGWRARGGDWGVQNGVLAQTSTDNDTRITRGSRDWTDYTYELKARKVDGAEGFLILFHVQNADRYVWWNLGGWGNSRTALEHAENGAKSEFGTAATNTIETGRWYDIKVEVEGPRIRGYLDGQLVTDATELPDANPDPIYATASRDQSSGDVFLHVVNVTSTPRQIDVNLQGVTKISGDADCEVLKGEPLDVNTLEEPEKVVPAASQIPGLTPKFTHEFPAHSVTVLRLNAK